MVFIVFIVLILCVRQDFVSCENQKLMETYFVELGDPVILNCTYNCSSGFVRGCWKTENSSKCTPRVPNREKFCTISLHLQNVSRNDLKKYYCYTYDTADTDFQYKTEHVVLLKLNDQTCCGSHVVTRKTVTTNISLPAEPKDSSAGNNGMNEGMKVLAAVTITVALVLAALAVYLCLSRSRQRCNGKDQPPVTMSSSQQISSAILPLNKGPTSTQSERVILRIPTPETEGDPEVPYADIVINVRGASTPDLSQALYSNSDHIEWWGVKPRTHLQAARSADMLHVPQPREVSRKMSTNSEYAVITYA